MTTPASRRPAGARRAGSRLSPLVLALVLLIVAAVALAFWWWSLRSLSDPIDANPVSTTATVVSSPPCDEGGRTTVRLSGVDSDAVSTLDGCGFTVGERLAVDYLAGDPSAARLTGTTRAGESPLIAKILPIVILVAGFAAVAMLGFAAVARRGRPAASGAAGSPRSRRRRGGGPAVTVDDLRARILASRAKDAGSRGPGPEGSVIDDDTADDDVAGDADPGPGAGGAADDGALGARTGTARDTVMDGGTAPRGRGAPGRPDGDRSDSARGGAPGDGSEPDRLAE